MRVLVLGGTLFLGRHVVEAALARGHEAVLFNRGRLNPRLFPQIEKLRGDRDGDLAALRGRRFEAVIDSSGYRPEQVRAVTDVLGGAINHYVFISSISAYREFPPHCPFDEDAPLAEGARGYGSWGRTIRRTASRTGPAGLRAAATCSHPAGPNGLYSWSTCAISPTGACG